jgi:hypothetical protein
MTGSLSLLLSNTTMKSQYYGNVRPALHHNTKALSIKTWEIKAQHRKECSEILREAKAKLKRR